MIFKNNVIMNSKDERDPNFTTTKAARNSLSKYELKILEHFLKSFGDDALGNFAKKLFGDNLLECSGTIKRKNSINSLVSFSLTCKKDTEDTNYLIPLDMSVATQCCVYTLKVCIDGIDIGNMMYRKMEGHKTQISNNIDDYQIRSMNGTIVDFYISKTLYENLLGLTVNMDNALLSLGKYFQLNLDGHIPSPIYIRNVFGAILHTFWCEFNGRNVTSPLAIHCGKYYGTCVGMKDLKQLLNRYSGNVFLGGNIQKAIEIPSELSEKILKEKTPTGARKQFYIYHKDALKNTMPKCLIGEEDTSEDLSKNLINNAPAVVEFLNTAIEHFNTVGPQIKPQFIQSLSDVNDVKLIGGKKSEDREAISDLFEKFHNLTKNADVLEDSDNSEDSEI